MRVLLSILATSLALGILAPPGGGAGEVRVAHCIIGLARALCDEKTYVSYTEHVIKPVGGIQDMYLIFGPKDQDPAYQRGLDMWKQAIGTGNLSLSYNGQAQAKKLVQCYTMLVEAERAGGFKYDYIIKSRPDLVMQRDLPPATKFSRDAIWIRPYYEEIMVGYEELLGDLKGLSVADKVYGEFKDLDSWYYNPNNRSRNMGVSDLFFIMPRTFSRFLTELPFFDVHYRRNATVATIRQTYCGQRWKATECMYKAIAGHNGYRLENRPFDLRILRQKGYMCTSPLLIRERDWGKWFNSLCEDHPSPKCRYAATCFGEGETTPFPEGMPIKEWKKRVGPQRTKHVLDFC